MAIMVAIAIMAGIITAEVIGTTDAGLLSALAPRLRRAQPLPHMTIATGGMATATATRIRCGTDGLRSSKEAGAFLLRQYQKQARLIEGLAPLTAASLAFSSADFRASKSRRIRAFSALSGTS